MPDELKKKILIINDLNIELKIYATLFEKEDFAVIRSTSPKEALALAVKEKPHCILVDSVMSEMDGTEFLRKTKSDPQLKNIPLILLTTTESTNTLINALKSGANDYILKNSDHRILVEKVRNLIKNSEIQSEYFELIKVREDFLSIVSHDLKSPIAFIEASMALLLESYASQIPKEASDFIGRSQRRARYALDLIHDILELGRTEHDRPKLEIFAIKPAIESCIENYILKISEKQILFIHNLDEFKGSINSDKNKFLQVVNNVLGNAIKFVPPKSQIKINAYLLEEIQSLRLEIEDNGPGIPPEKLNTIFEKYNRGNIQGGQTGSGLGLAICRQICKQLSGNIWAENKDDGGAIFKILLPGISHEHKTILVCDDSLTIRNYLFAILEKAGYHTLVADCGEKALEIISEQIPSVVVMDMIMPGMNGIQTIQAMRKIPGCEKIPVIFQTSYKNDEALDEISHLAQDFISKPVREKDFLKKVGHFFTEIQYQTPYNSLVMSSQVELYPLVSEVLESRGWHCVFAKSAYEASFFTKKLRFNLIVADARCGNIEGAEFAQSIAQQQPEAVLYVLSDDRLNDQFLYDLGVRNILKAPMDKAKILLLASAGKLLNTTNQTQRVLRILLADDSEDGVLLVKTFLSKTKAEITTVANGEQAFQEFIKDHYDLILIDQEMPILNGFEATRKIRKWESENKRKPSLIWALTAHDSSLEIRRALDAGCDTHIAKPIKKDELIKLIRKIKI